MRREWSAEELIGGWTLIEEDWRLLGNKSGTTRLGFSLLLEFFELEGRFPRHAGDVPRSATDYVAHQVKVPPAQFADYDWAAGPSSTTGPRSARRSGHDEDDGRHGFRHTPPLPSLTGCVVIACRAHACQPIS
jgi:hypothetical protein